MVVHNYGDSSGDRGNITMAVPWSYHGILGPGKHQIAEVIKVVSHQIRGDCLPALLYPPRSRGMHWCKYVSLTADAVIETHLICVAHA